MSKTDRYEFDAVIEEGRSGGALVAVPLDVPAEFGTRGQVRVRASFDGVDYRGSLAPMGGRHILGIRKAIREEIGKGIGDTVRVVLGRDIEERTVELPPELMELFRNRPETKNAFDALSFTHRREYAEWVASGKKPETRARRTEGVRERLKGGDT